MGRNYVLFGLLTNGQVRISENTQGIAPPCRGVPENLSYSTARDYFLYVSDEDNADGEHSCSRADAKRWGGRFARYTFSEGVEWYDPEKHGELVNGLPPVMDADDKPYYWRTEHPDWHSASWLVADELEAVLEEAYVEWWKERQDEGDEDAVWPREFVAVLGAMRALEETGALPRFVYWFDN